VWEKRLGDEGNSPLKKDFHTFKLAFFKLASSLNPDTLALYH
jgi:hypothetical protein